MTTTEVFTGAPTASLIAPGNPNPWIEIDGQPVDWMRRAPSLPQAVTWCGDGGCNAGPLAGVLVACDTPQGIQRCDQCNIYDGDREAALALAQMVGGVVVFEVNTEQ